MYIFFLIWCTGCCLFVFQICHKLLWSQRSVCGDPGWPGI